MSLLWLGGFEVFGRTHFFILIILCFADTFIRLMQSYCHILTHCIWVLYLILLANVDSIVQFMQPYQCTRWGRCLCMTYIRLVLKVTLWPKVLCKLWNNFAAEWHQTLHLCRYYLCFVFGRFQIQILAWRLAVMTNVFRGLPQSMGFNVSCCLKEDMNIKLSTFQRMCGTIDEEQWDKKTLQSTQLKFYKVAVVPMLTYASEKWTVNWSDKRKIRVS